MDYILEDVFTNHPEIVSNAIIRYIESLKDAEVQKKDN